MSPFQFLSIDRTPSPEVLQLLLSNVIGTPKKSMVYQHQGTLTKVRLLQHPFFVSLFKKAKVIGTCCFCSRTTLVESIEIPAYYIRYFTFHESYRRRTIASKKVFRQSQLKQEVSKLLDGNGLEKADRFFQYAYVDPRNVRSIELCREFGFETVREYTTILFNRVKPKTSNLPIEELSMKDTPHMKELLSAFYKNHSMFSFENLFGERRYFILKNKEGEIRAGVQANPDHWRVYSLPGKMGAVTLAVFSRLPILSQIINKDYRFLALDGIFYAPGAEHELEILIEHLLALHRVNTAIAVVDAHSNLYKTLKSLKLGLANKLNKEVRGHVICRFTGFTKSEKEPFFRAPAYISGIDVT